MEERKPTAAEVDALLTQRLRELGARGGIAASKKLTAAERKQRALKAAPARWGKRRK
jgi:hypothetical protein